MNNYHKSAISILSMEPFDDPAILSQSVSRNRPKDPVSDGYKKTQKMTEYMYEWIYDVPPSQYVPIPQPDIQITYEPAVESIHMNWGWDASYNSSSIWFSPGGNWSINGFVYNYYKHMITGFRAL